MWVRILVIHQQYPKSYHIDIPLPPHCGSWRALVRIRGGKHQTIKVVCHVDLIACESPQVPPECESAPQVPCKWQYHICIEAPFLLAIQPTIEDMKLHCLRQHACEADPTHFDLLRPRPFPYIVCHIGACKIHNMEVIVYEYDRFFGYGYWMTSTVILVAMPTNWEIQSTPKI